MKIRLSPFRMVLLLLAVLAFLCFFVFAGYSTSGLLCLGIMGLLVFYRWARRLRDKYPKFAKAVVRIVTAILCICLVVFAITEFFIVRASFGNPDESCDYLLVLGAKVNPNGPSVSLQNRINAAYDYLTAHPDAIAILSGGQGSDEPVTEAQCMFDRLTAMGIDPARLWLEDRSTSTWENLKFTLALLEEKTGTTPEKIAMVSSEYHLFRAGLFAHRFGLETVGIPAQTTILSLKVNYFIREAAAVWYFILFGGQIYG